MECFRKDNALANGLCDASSEMENESPKPQIHAYTLVLWVFAFLAILPQETFSQKSSIQRKAKKLFEQAEVAFQQGNLQQTEQLLRNTLAYNQDNANAWMMMGELMLEKGQPEEAIQAFQRVIASDSTFNPLVYAILGKLFYESGTYDSSVYYYRFSLKESDLKLDLRKELLKRKTIAEDAFRLTQNPLNVDLMNLGKAVNSQDDEYINSLRLDGGQLLFTRKSPKIINQNALFEERFFISEPEEGMKWKSAAMLKPDWSDAGNMGAVSFSSDGKKLIFAGCEWFNGFGSCDIYSSALRDGNWLMPNNLGRSINSSSWDSQPCLSADGKNLFFVSNRPGGFGGSDIYTSILLEDGSWSKPMNLGPTVNTSLNEMAPYIHADGQTLYFSSEGHGGLGGSDIFISRKDATARWGEPENMGFPINTKYDEINLIVPTEGGTGFLSTNKEGGFGGFDIYSFEMPLHLRPQPMVYVKATIVDAATMNFLDASYVLYELNGEGLIFEGTTASDDGLLLAVLKARSNYALRVEKDGYLFQSVTFSPELNEQSEPYELLIKLEPVVQGSVTVLSNVFFNVNDSKIQPSSFFELDKLAVFLSDNPTLIVELGGHTDNTGLESFNAKLSLDRANAVKEYLMAKGIEGDRMQTSGYGSSQPVISNETEEGRRMNRRTTLTILH